jgi:hypothetical protein
MSRLAVVPLLFGLVGCALFGNARQAGPQSMQGWRFLSGRTPTRAEYTAVVAACRDGAVRDARAEPLDACLADLGLRRAE